MKVLLTTLNAKYIHTSLALRYLEASCQKLASFKAGSLGIVRQEYTINADLDNVLGAIYSEAAQVAAFSCYIWNIKQILILTANLKKVAPDTIVLLGGPEVSYGPEEILQQSPWIDIVITGEGEESLPAVLESLLDEKKAFEDIAGVWWRDKERVKSARESCPKPVSPERITSPYQGELTEFSQQIAYLETSRGCPYSCTYCLSSSTKGVRHLPLEQIKQDIKKLIGAGAKQIKFVDRTFNANKHRAISLWKFLLEETGDTKINYHFEISASLLDQDTINFLSQVPSGLFQFEIGIQSANPKTLQSINRQMSWDKLRDNVRGLRQNNNIHLHLDLIAGLPFEDYASFLDSLNQVLELKPHYLQLGFLKLLKGTRIRKDWEEHGYVFTAEPPYQVLSNKYITYQQLLGLKNIEELVDKLYNSQQFYYTINYLLKSYPVKYQLFVDLANYFNKLGRKIGQLKQKELYEILLSFCQDNWGETKEVVELLTIDLLRQQRLAQLPDWSILNNKQRTILQQVYQYLSNQRQLAKHLAYYPISQATYLELFREEIYSYPIVLLFDYRAEPDPIIGGAKFTKIVLEG